LGSEEFYQQSLHSWLYGFLQLTTLHFFLKDPEKLLLLREALREQEERLYADAHLHPEQTVSDLLSSYLPPRTPNETEAQKMVRNQLFRVA
jgi:hypothetical protein